MAACMGRRVAGHKRPFPPPERAKREGGAWRWEPCKARRSELVADLEGFSLKLLLNGENAEEYSTLAVGLA